LDIEDLARAAALHWGAPEQDRLGDWLLRAAEGFTVEGAAEPTLPEHRRDLVKVRRCGPGTSHPANT
jgi:hypothetical protein